MTENVGRPESLSGESQVLLDLMVLNCYRQYRKVTTVQILIMKAEILDVSPIMNVELFQFLDYKIFEPSYKTLTF